MRFGEKLINLFWRIIFSTGYQQFSTGYQWYTLMTLLYGRLISNIFEWRFRRFSSRLTIIYFLTLCKIKTKESFLQIWKATSSKNFTSKQYFNSSSKLSGILQKKSCTIFLKFTNMAIPINLQFQIYGNRVFKFLTAQVLNIAKNLSG